MPPTKRPGFRRPAGSSWDLIRCMMRSAGPGSSQTGTRSLTASGADSTSAWPPAARTSARHSVNTSLTCRVAASAARQHGLHDAYSRVSRQRRSEARALGDGRPLLHDIGDLGGQDDPFHHRRGLGEGAASEPAARAPGRIARVPVEHAGVHQSLRAQEALDLGALPVDLLGDPVHADQERRAVGAAQLQRAERLAVHKIEGRGQEVRAHDSASGRPRFLEAGEARDHQPIGVGARPELHGRLDDHSERPEGADEELGQVVAGDVLDHLAAALDERARRRDHGHADEEIAARSVEVTPRTGRIARENAAERRFVGMRWVEREPLAAPAELALERAQGHARLNGRGQIARLVLEKPVQPLQREHEAQALGRGADAHLGPAAPRRHGHLRFGGGEEDGRDFLLGSGKRDGLRRAAVDDIRPAVHPGEHVCGADNAAKLV